ncbi:unnamed protein product [Phyllotreta striolata]|uniref:Aminopeptidase n=1 Tax=Phyllotreta striolata TaxID=444603 RepID=A0A9N9TR66_PHYSR|nr:unnamed protein product [Phyllotreta striolata]
MQFIFRNFVILFGICQFHSSLSYYKKFRLPEHVKPINYNLYLKIEPTKNYFYGKVQISLKILNETTNSLYLHADHDYIEIKTIELNGTKCNSSIHQNVATNIFPIKCPLQFRTGQVLKISYKGKIGNDMSGVYRSTYDDGIIVATNFEPNYARRAFPCFDEPEFKATFEITIENPRLYNALSNAPSESILIRNTSVTKFQKTPIMSPYLLAFVVSQLRPAILKDQDFNVFARPSEINHLGIAINYGPKLFDYMSQWTGIQYADLGNPQEYLVALPDFAAGAMENWGLIIFREMDLLDSGNKTSVDSFQTILMVMGHEIAHQWFGNYVTLDWWSNVWLNEGFANYFGKIITDGVVNGTFELDKQSVVTTLQKYLEKDSLVSSKPLSAPYEAVQTNFEINLAFDELAYYKGECIVRMIRNILGKDNFRRGIQNYLTKNKYKNVSPEKFLQSFEDAPGNKIINLEEKMHNWIYKAGYPLVTVTQTDNTTVRITQERFCTSTTCNATTQWYVPISYTTQSENNFSINIKDWLKPNKPLEINHDSKEWLIVNLQQNGFYRVNYDKSLWAKIIKDLTTSMEIDPLNRAQLIDDIFHLAKAGKISYNKAFELAQYLKHETSYYPWFSAIRSFYNIIDNVDSNVEILLKKWLLNLISDIPRSLPNSQSHIAALQQTLIIEFACKIGHKKYLAYAEKRFKAFKRNKNLIPVEYTFLCYGLMYSNNLQDDYNFLLNIFNTSTSYEQYQILIALGCMNDEEFLMKYLKLTIIEPSPIRQQDFTTLFNSVYYNNKLGIGVALDFMFKYFKAMEFAYGGVTGLPSLMIDIAEKITTEENIKKMDKILDYYKENENVKLVEASVNEIIDTNQQWRNNYEMEIQNYLKKSTSGSARFYPEFNIAYIVSYCVFYIITM